MAYIETISYEDAEGELKDIYDQLINDRGKLADVHRIQSLNPPTIVSHMQLYMDVMFGKSPLRRYQREMIAVVVSAANQCEYCIQHHAEALLHYWKNEEKLQQLQTDFEQLDLSETDSALCRYAHFQTLAPQNSDGSQVEALRQTELSDRAILDATLIIGYFNFVNRIVLSLGLAPNEEEVKGYKY